MPKREAGSWSEETPVYPTLKSFIRRSDADWTVLAIVVLHHQDTRREIKVQ